ncbi:hypothetical protein BC834DRAFT_871678 [Gloeopeniophorella convolvens]|nr:hypothetical protein BC834DRAFT_871678 [Gloeopeniophorella convolvens]
MDPSLRSRSSSRSDLASPRASSCVYYPHKAHSSPLSATRPSSVSSPSTSPSISNHIVPALISTPRRNEANTPLPTSHYITSSFPSTPRRSSRIVSSPLLTPSSSAAPALAMAYQAHASTSSSSRNVSPHDQPRPSSRSERLLRETLRRDRALSLSPRSRVRRAESHSGRITSTSGEMFHCACTDGDDHDDDNDDDDDDDDTPHVSLLFVNTPQQQQKHAPPLQRASRSSADVQALARSPFDVREKEPIPPVPSPKSTQRSVVPQSQLENYLRGAIAQAREQQADRDWAWSSPESSSLSSPTSSHLHPLTPSPSPPSYATLPEALSRAVSTRGRTRNHTDPTGAVSLSAHPRPSHSRSQSHTQTQQVTPPPTPPTFDARGAAAKLRAMDGYVSFANVEGLGPPPGADDDAMGDDRRRGSWWPWRGRSRSGSLGAP